MFVARLPPRAGSFLRWSGALAAVFVPHCPSASAAPADVCAQLGGNWSVGEQFCGKVVVNANQTKTVLEARYPADLVESGASGSALQKYLKDFIARFSKVTDDPRATDGGATLRYRQFEHPPALTSVLFSNIYYTGNAKYPVEELTSFTFDAAKGRALALPDLFQSGERALSDLARLARPTVQSQLEPVNEVRAGENQPPLRAEDFDPGGLLNPGSYPVFVVSADELVLYMPQVRSGEPGSAMIEAHIPLSSLRDMLRPEYR
ncbi:DUF3298 domain-containing protein [Segniliparus rotundus]|uniref:DUF3298 domain-containing protein n=1 Tax=Segniliparus rotundus TaxID=286802 RepID=UPI000300C06C|nr:DUF3298 domain-containing protein [Segniliparus rotundus]